MDLIILVITLVTNTFLGGLVYLRDRTSRKSQLFGVMSGAIVVWILSNFLTNYDAGSSLILNDVANRVAFITGYGVVFAGLLFTYVFPKQHKINSYELTFIYSLAVCMMLLSATSLVSGGVHRTVDGVLEYSIGPLLWLYMAAFILNVILLGKNLISTIRHERGTKKSQSILVLLAFGISAPVGLTINLILPVVLSASWQVTQFGPLATVFLVSLIAYSIIRHGLFDIRLAAMRTAAYVLALISLSAIYYFLAYLASVFLFQGKIDSSVSVSPINILLALLLAFIFQPIKQFFDRITDRVFYRDRYHAEDFYARLSEVLTTTTDLRSLLQRASKEISSTLKAEHAFFFVQYNHVHHISAGIHEHRALPMHDIHTLNEYVEREGGDIIVTELVQDTTTRRLLLSHKIAVLMPLMREMKVLGYLALGDHQASGYTKRDVRVLNTVSDELVIAIQNALSVQEVKDINENLQQRIDEATRELRASNERLKRIDTTKDEFLSMASHQLRTPLTSIKGYLSMVLEGDAGKITNMQKHLLSEAFNGSERMVHLIHDFLNVSRIQTGKFLIDKKETNLVDLVSEEVASLVSVAEVRDLKLKTELPKEPVLLDLDESKMRQVVMNFIDNAIYYSKPDTTILITLTLGRETVKVKVIDQGIGVPVAQQEKLFTKFFRADNARKQRPDGTGVGLYLAKKVIDGHNGKLIFASKEGEGSTFGFELPLKYLAHKQAN